MNPEINDGGPAFPVTPTDRTGQIAETFMGLSLRDYFASKAMQGLLSSGTGMRMPAKQIANLSYEQADEMIERSNK